MGLLYKVIIHVQSHLQKPWAPAHDAELIPGSLHSARVVVASKQARLLMKRFIGRLEDPAAGISSEEYSDMLLQYGQSGQPLARFLVRGYMKGMCNVTAL